MADEEKNEPTEETPDDAAPEAAEEAAPAAAEEAPAEEAAEAPADEAPAEDAPAEEEAAAEESAAEEAAPAEETAADEPPADEEDAPAADEAPAEEPPADEPPAAPAADGDAEQAEVPTPKQQRKLDRSRASGEARPQRSPEERITERAEARGRNAANRRRYRQRTRGKHRDAGAREGTPPADRAPGPKKVRLGKVVSTKADKTITVQIEVARRHPTYEKVVRRSATLHAHDAENAAGEGDTVRIVETRPLSRTKRWRLLEIVEKAR